MLGTHIGGTNATMNWNLIIGALLGLVAGLVAGLTMHQAQEMGTLVAALSTTSPHTINEHVGRKSLHRFATAAATPTSDAVTSLLIDPEEK